ncbi:MAG: hypothetical protein R3B90_22360 [Planctomycetaceae bacterium]
MNINRDDRDDTPEAQREAAAQWRRLELAATAPGIAGDLRRALDAAGLPTWTIAAECGIDTDLLEQFREGLADLPLSDVENLAERLGLHVSLTPNS